MRELVKLYQAHEIWGTLMLTTLWTAFVGSFAAPTKTSSALYVFWFKFSNTLAGNIQRANSTSIEQSPNFLDAANAKLIDAGRAPLAAEPAQPAKTTDWQQDSTQEKK